MQGIKKPSFDGLLYSNFYHIITNLLRMNAIFQSISPFNVYNPHMQRVSEETASAVIFDELEKR